MYKTLVQRLGSKPNQIIKTEVNLFHNAYSNMSQDVLKRTSINSQGKDIKWSMWSKGKQRCTKWTIKLENPNQNRNASNGYEFFYTSYSCYEQSSCKNSNPEELKW